MKSRFFSHNPPYSHGAEIIYGWILKPKMPFQMRNGILDLRVSMYHDSWLQRWNWKQMNNSRIELRAKTTKNYYSKYTSNSDSQAKLKQTLRAANSHPFSLTLSDFGRHHVRKCCGELGMGKMCILIWFHFTMAHPNFPTKLTRSTLNLRFNPESTLSAAPNHSDSYLALQRPPRPVSDVLVRSRLHLHIRKHLGAMQCA